MRSPRPGGPADYETIDLEDLRIMRPVDLEVLRIMRSPRPGGPADYEACRPGGPADYETHRPGGPADYEAR